ncbi:MAG: S-adenosylmethionine decarboxylase [Hyphomicrobium sp.]|jgi:S-adenosylmethionine decarboxylase|nr:S-adenosylmethionine decarboxylase [Hyphomicrobium sp.]
MAYNDALFQLGMDLTRSSTAQKEDHCEVASDVRNESVAVTAAPGAKGSGRNLFIDLHGASRLGDAKSAERALKVALGALGKQPRAIEISRLADGTLSGVAVLGIGHLSFQANPKSEFVAVDVRGCAGLDPHAAMFALADAFAAREAAIQTTRASDVVFLPAAKSVKVRAKAAPRRREAKAA